MTTRFTLIAALVVVAGLQPMVAQQTRAHAEKLLAAAQHKATVDGDLQAAITQYSAIAETFKNNHAVAAAALVRLAECYDKLGDTLARSVYERIVREYADQTEQAALARTSLSALRSPPATQTGPAARLIWNDVDESQYRPTGLSADGRYVSFTDGVRGRTGDLTVRDLRDGTTRFLTRTTSYSEGNAADSLVSPDGRHVAYWWETLTTAFPGNDLRILPLSEGKPGEPRVVHRSDETKYMAPFGWTPDGKSLLVLRQVPDSTWQIAVVSIAEGAVRVLKSLEWRQPRGVSLSPDGRSIAYDDAPSAGAGVPARDIFLLAADGGRETVVVQNPANDRQPVWSPDGSQLLFVSNRTGNDALWRVHIDAGKPVGSPELVKADIGRLLGMTRSGTLYYLSGGPTSNIYTVDVDANIKVKTAPSLATGPFIDSNAAPGASPDGQYLAYARQRPSGSTLTQVSPDPIVIVIRSLKTGEEREVRPGLLFVNGPMRWFPDRRSLLVRSPDPQGNRLGFYRVDTTSGRAELLLNVTTRIWRSADLSPDGKSIFYIDSSQRLMRFDVESRRETEFPAEGRLAEVMSVAVSPDGAQLAYVLSGGLSDPARCPCRLEVIPVGGGEPREVFRDNTVTVAGRVLRMAAGLSPFQSLAWTPDQRYLLFVANSAGTRDNVQELWRVPVTGGAPETTGISVRGKLWSPALDPGGRRITYQANEERASELWALENFLPPLSAKRQ